jgi:hypothetical protein
MTFLTESPEINPHLIPGPLKIDPRISLDALRIQGKGQVPGEIIFKTRLDHEAGYVLNLDRSTRRAAPGATVEGDISMILVPETEGRMILAAGEIWKTVTINGRCSRSK